MNSGAAEIVRLAGISRVYETHDTETRAVQDIDLAIHQGEYICVTGPSGCGKSTLLSIIGLLDTATSGQYLLKDHRVDEFDSYQRAELRNREIGFIFQAFNLIGDLRVVENVELPLLYKEISKQERREIAMDKLEKVQLTARANHYPSQLYGGQQQRVAVARASQPSPRCCWLMSRPGISTPAMVRLSWTFWMSCTMREKPFAWLLTMHAFWTE